MDLKPLGEAEIEAELTADRATAYYEAELVDLPLTRLTDRTFELLAYCLSKSAITSGASPFTRAALLNVGADKGRDLLLLKDQEVSGIVQCKRYEKPIGLPDVLQELMRFALLAIREPQLVPNPDGFVYQLWTAGELTGGAVEFFSAPKAYIFKNGVTLAERAAKARMGVKSLESSNRTVADAENAAAVALVSQFNIEWVGPVDIKCRLSDDEVIRRRFFRGPNDTPRRARASDVNELLASMRRIREPSQRTHGPYVERSTLCDGFQRFLAVLSV